MLNLLCNITAGDCLAFAGALGGALIGALITCWSVVKTIKEGKKSDNENRISANKPWITTNYRPIDSLEAILNISDKIGGCVEFYKNSFQFISCIPNHVQYSDYKFNQTEVIIYYKIRNVGAGSATNLEVTINQNKKVLPINALFVGEERAYLFILPYSDNQTIHQIKFKFSDILSRVTYEQLEIFRLREEKNYGIIVGQKEEDFITEPIAITEGDNRNE